MTDFDTMVERIKADGQGTLIVICGRVGCGKSTLAFKLMRTINGSDDVSYIVTQSDLMRLECCRSVPDVRAHIIEDVLDCRFMERGCKLATIGYIPIVTVTDLNRIPRQYRGPSKGGLSSVLVIQFGGQRGEFKAIHSVLKGERLSTAEASGTVTQEDVDKVRRRVVLRMAGMRKDMMEYWKDCKTGETHLWSSDDKNMVDWMRDHPPMYSWRVRLSKDESYVTLTEYNPDGKGVIPHICDIKGIGMCSTEGSASYEIHCNDPGMVCARLMCIDMNLRRDKHYALVHRRAGLGMTDELVNYCLMYHAPTNYGQNSEAFDYVTGFPCHWGYGAHGEVRFSEIEYPNGESWDTYQNERGYTKDDPNVEERIRWCNRINISINLSLDTKTTPTSVLAKALRFTDDPRVKAIVEEIFTEDDVTENHDIKKEEKR